MPDSADSQTTSFVPALAIDYGRATVGLALATGPLVELLPAVARSQLVPVLSRLVGLYSPRFLIVGLPDGRLRPEVKRFITHLKSVFPSGLPQVLPWDETLSSHDARSALSHTTARRRQSREHSAAAAIILQSWLDSVLTGIVK